jgi:hypothetical protein
LTIQHIRFTSTHVFDVAGINQANVKATLLQKFIEWDSVHTCRFHHHGVYLTVGQPVG